MSQPPYKVILKVKCTPDVGTYKHTGYGNSCQEAYTNAYNSAVSANDCGSFSSYIDDWTCEGPPTPTPTPTPQRATYCMMLRGDELITMNPVDLSRPVARDRGWRDARLLAGRSDHVFILRGDELI